MNHYQKAFEDDQRARWLRPDAHRWIRPNAASFLKPGTSVSDVFPSAQSMERKYSPDQPRDDHGRWTDEGGGGAQGSSTSLIQDILARAEKLGLTGSPADYAKCVNLCYPILERFSRPGSDRNYWNFQKCMNACLGLNR